MATGFNPSARPQLNAHTPRVNTQTLVLDSNSGKTRILCLADIRGKISQLNQLARDADAAAIIHTGDFGFFELNSLERINDRTLRHLVLYSPLFSSEKRAELLADVNSTAAIRSYITESQGPTLSEFPQLLSGAITLDVPVYTVWGACEDVMVLEKFRSGEYSVRNLHVLDEATTRCIDIGGVKLRLLGLGGALVPHKMFDNGEGRATIAGSQGTMWTTALQIGELVDTAQRTYDQSETRVLVSHASPGREGLLSQLALVLRCDLSISASLHFRYSSSYNEFSVQSDMDGFRAKLLSSKENFYKVWENVKGQVEAVIDDHQRVLLDKFLSVVDRVPPVNAEEPGWKNLWSWNLCDAAYGNLILDVREGRVSAELKSQGFNYAYRRASAPNGNTSSVPPLPESTPTARTPKPSAVANSEPIAKTPTAGAEGSSPNGIADASSVAPSEKGNKKKKKDKEREKRDDLGLPGGPDRAPTPLSLAASKPLPRSNAPSPAPSASASKAPQNTSSIPSPTETAGSGPTPIKTTSRNPPWTLFLSSLPQNITDGDLTAFFRPTSIASMKIPMNHNTGKTRGLAYVSFESEDLMKQGLEKHRSVLNGSTVNVVIADERPPHHEGGDSGRGSRGRGRGRGGGRGGIRPRNDAGGSEGH